MKSRFLLTRQKREVVTSLSSKFLHHFFARKKKERERQQNSLDEQRCIARKKVPDFKNSISPRQLFERGKEEEEKTAAPVNAPIFSERRVFFLFVSPLKNGRT